MNRKYFTYQMPHGYNTGIVKSKICPTIDRTIAFQHILLTMIDKKEKYRVDTIISYGNLSGSKHQSRMVYGIKGICPTLIHRMDKSNTIPYIVVKRKKYGN